MNQVCKNIELRRKGGGREKSRGNAPRTPSIYLGRLPDLVQKQGTNWNSQTLEEKAMKGWNASSFTCDN